MEKIFVGCTKECKPRWVVGRGSFMGWRIKLCKIHQVIHAMKKDREDV